MPAPQFVVFHLPGSKWDPQRPLFEQPGLQEHIEHYRTLSDRGKLMIGGPFLDAAAGGMMVAAVGVTGEELEAFASADPSVKAGLLTYTVRPWLVGMKSP